MFNQDELVFMYHCVDGFKSNNKIDEKNKHVMCMKLLDLIGGEEEEAVDEPAPEVSDE